MNLTFGRDRKRRKAVLRNLKVTRVDLCRQGINPDSHITLAKAAATDIDTNHPDSEGADTDMAENENPLEGLTDEDVDAIGTYVTDLVSELDAANAKAAEAALALSKAAESADSEDDAEEDELLKSLPEPIRERLEKAEQSAADANDKADRIEKAERERVFKARAAALPALTGGDGDGAVNLGVILEKANAALPADDYDELERVLVAADAQVTQAGDDLFKATGQDSVEDADGSSVLARIAARTDELVTEGLPRVEAMQKARRESNDFADYQSSIAKGSRA